MKKNLCMLILLLSILLTACGKSDSGKGDTVPAFTDNSQLVTNISENGLAVDKTDAPGKAETADKTEVPEKNDDVEAANPSVEKQEDGAEYIYPVTGSTYQAGIYYIHPMGYGLTLEIDSDGTPHELGSVLDIRVVDSVCDFKLVEEITSSAGDVLNAETMPQLVDADNDPTGIFGYIGNHISFSVNKDSDICEMFSFTFGIRRQTQNDNGVVGFSDIRGGQMVYYTIWWDYAGTVSLTSNEMDWTFKKTDTRYGLPYLRPTPVPLEEMMVDEIESGDEEEEITWYIEDRTLYVNKIYYDTVRDLTGHAFVEIEDPWSQHFGEYDAAVFDVVLEQRRKQFTMNNRIETADYDTISLESLGLRGTELEYLDATINLGSIKNVNYLLAGTNIKHIDLKLNGKVRSAYALFMNDSELETASISVTGPVQTVTDMFYCCESLRDVNVDIDLSLTTGMSRMFFGCRSLSKVRLSNINDGCGGIFSDCDSLSFVDCDNVFITKPANWMFNEVNSIGNYRFAENWNIFYNVIADDVYRSYVYYEPMTSIWMVYVVFNKITPGWFTKFMEQTQGVTDMKKIVDNEILKVYINTTEKVDEDGIRKAMLSSIDTALKEISAAQGVDVADKSAKALEFAGYYDDINEYIK